MAVTDCAEPDDGFSAVEARSKDQVVRLGNGYLSVSTLWRGSDPNVLIWGDNGGSSGSGDLIAVTFSDPISTRKLSGERLDEITVHSGSARL